MLSSESRPNSATIARSTFVIFGIAIGLFVFWLIKDILLLTLTAVVFAVLLTSPIRYFVRRGLPRPLALIFTIVLIIAVIAISTALILPDLGEQFRILAVNTIPAAVKTLETELTPDKLAQAIPFLQDVLKGLNIADLTKQISDQILLYLAGVPGFLGNILSTLISILIIIFLSLYFVADPEMHWRGLIRLIPLPYRPRAREILSKLDLTLRRFLQAQVVLMIMTGAATTIGLILLRLPLAGVLGVITGIFSFIPNFGPIIAIIPIMAVAIINPTSNFALVLLVFFLIQFLISQIVAPLLLGQEVNLPPAMILLSQIVAGILFGFLGILLSVPLAAMGSVLIREIYVRDILGDTDVGQRHTQELQQVPPTVPERAWK